MGSASIFAMLLKSLVGFCDAFKQKKQKNSSPAF
jgi:hypothetical protein